MRVLSPEVNVRRHSRWGPIDFSFTIIMSLDNENEVSKTQAMTRLFFSTKNLYCADGWVDGGQKGPSIFLKFKYVDNYVMKILNIGKKFVTNFLMSLKI